MSYFYDNRDDDDDQPYFTNFNRASDHKEFNKRILLTAIVSLTLVLVLVSALHLYARFVLKRQARRRAAIHQLTLTVAQAHTLSTESNNIGLSSTIISTLPTFLFKQKQPQQKQNQQHSSSHVDECSVCLSVFEDEEIVKLLPNCKHTFHVGCIDTWLASNSTCPVCRTKVEPRIEPQPREGPTELGLYGAPSAPVLFDPLLPVEGTSDGGGCSPKSNSRLSSFRRILSRERSSKRIQPSSCDDDINRDLERQ